ncbi:MAG TPA: carboxypeptidase regulatory-like domain-containing protein [Thermoanaerobaculia bacterium]|nr:carboxypeptidase regulatory-like domain-containing protein [Thermoanaerobaculia bacterium]
MARLRFLICPLLFLATLPLLAAVTGRVLDEDGKPLRAVRVRVRALETIDATYARLLSKEPMPQWLATAETNDSGAFQLDAKSNPVVELMIDAPGRQAISQDILDNEDAGTFVLRKAAARKGRVTANGKGVAGAVVAIGRSYVVLTDEQGNYEAPEPTGFSERIQVIHPNYAIADRQLRASPREELSFDVALKPGTAVRGRVVDGAGRAVAGAVVRAWSWPLAKSGEDGSFEIAHAPGEKAALYAREGNRAGSLYLDRTKPPYVITLRPAATVTGSVRSNKDDTPVAGARVTIRGDAPEVYVPYAISDAKGNFTVDGLEAGTRRFFVMHPAFFGGNAEVRLEEGARVHRVLPVTPFARIAGKVLDDEQKPVAGASITVAGPGLSAKSAPDGTFSLRFPSFNERGISVLVSKKEFATGNYGPYALEPGEVKGGLVFRLTRGNRLEIRLVDRDGVPVPREPVSIARKTDSRLTTTMPCGSVPTGQDCRADADGRIVYQLAEGTYDVNAGGDLTVRRTLPGQTLNARSSPLVIELERGAPIEGRVVWSDGTPIPMTVTVSTTTNPPANTQTTEGGMFTLRNVAAGKLTLVVEGVPPTLVQGNPVEVTAPASGVVLKVPRFGRVEGRVVDRETEKGVHEFTISLQQTGGRGRMLPPRPFRSDDGRFVLEDLAPGNWDLRVQAPGFSRSSASVTVEEAKTASASVSLDRGGTVVGRVIAEGRPLSDVSVMVSSDPGMRFGASPTTTDSNGEFTLEGVAGGSIRIDARRSGYAPASVTVNVAPGKETRTEIELTRGRELRGRVIDSSGRPVPQADLMTRGIPGGGPGFGMASTDAEGMFKLSGLTDRNYTLVARKDGFAETTMDVNPATTNDITITLGRGGTVTGRVLGVGPNDLPFVDIRGMRSASIVHPDATGAYSLTGVPDGDVMIFASLMRPRPRSVQASTKVINGMSPPVDLDFNAGIAVRGRVTQQGQLVQGQINFMPVVRQPGPTFGMSEIARDGTYELRLSAQGEYDVTVSRFGTGAQVKAGRVNVTGDMVHDIELRGATVSGVVLDATTRQPIPNAVVAITQLGGEQRTNGAGRFSFDLVADGKYQLRAQAEGYAPALQPLEVSGSGAPAVELMLSRGIEAAFRIVDAATGQPLETGGVSIMDAVSKAPIAFSVQPSDVTGLRRVTLLPGMYLLFAFAQGYAPMRQPVTLTVPGPPVDVRLERQQQP